MLFICTTEIVYALAYFTTALAVIAGSLMVLTQFYRLPGTRLVWDLIPFVSYMRIFLDPEAMLTPRGYQVWKLYQVLYVLVITIMLGAYFTYLPACIAARGAG